MTAYATPNEHGVFTATDDVVPIPLPKKLKGEISIRLFACADGWRHATSWRTATELSGSPASVTDRAWPSRGHALGDAWTNLLLGAPEAFHPAIDRAREALGKDGPLGVERFLHPAKPDKGGLFDNADCERDEMTPNPYKGFGGDSRLDCILLAHADDGWRWALTITAACGTESSRVGVEVAPLPTRHGALLAALQAAIEWFHANVKRAQQRFEIIEACQERMKAIVELHQGAVPTPVAEATSEPAPAPAGGGPVRLLTAVTLSEPLREYLVLRGIVTVNRLRDVVTRTSIDDLLIAIKGTGKVRDKYRVQIEQAIKDLPANAPDDLPGLGLSPGVCGSLATLYEIVQIDDLTQWAFDDADVIKTFLAGLREDDRLLIERTLRFEGVERTSVTEFAKLLAATPAPEPEVDRESIPLASLDIKDEFIESLGVKTLGDVAAWVEQDGWEPLLTASIPAACELLPHLAQHFADKFPLARQGLGVTSLSVLWQGRCFAPGDLPGWWNEDPHERYQCLQTFEADDRANIYRLLRSRGIDPVASALPEPVAPKPITPAPGPDPLIADYYRAMRDAAAREVKAEARVAEAVAELREARAELKAAVAETRRLNRGGTAALAEQRTLSFEGAA